MKIVLNFHFTTLTDYKTGSKIMVGSNSENGIYYISQDGELRHSNLLRVNKEVFSSLFLLNNLDITNNFERSLQTTI